MSGNDENSLQVSIKMLKEVFIYPERWTIGMRTELEIGLNSDIMGDFSD